LLCLSLVLSVASPLGGRYVIEHKQKQPFWCGLYYR
ncbi:hypothetical protein VCHC44C1_3387B, partial [Vibrio cholerae HC-44C1]